jgi:hypothetical protein
LFENMNDDAITRDALALESLQVFRRLLLPRCLLLAAVVGAAGAMWPAAVPWWALAGVCLLVPAAVRVLELVYEQRLSRRLGGVLVRESRKKIISTAAPHPEDPAKPSIIRSRA